jgi:hypothetical protein
MTEYTTIRVSEAAKAAAQDAKRDDETWNDYIQRCTDTPPNTTELVPVEDALAELRDHGSGSATGIDADALAERVAERTSDAVVSELEARR